MGVDLPEELVVDILYKLPVKVICKLKCVSKGWLNLLSDPEFKKNHHNRSKKKPNLLLLRQDDNKLNVSWSSVRGNDQDAFTLLVDKDKYVGWPLKKPSGCGLICLWCRNPFNHEVEFNVLNPSTHELKSLPLTYKWDCPVRQAGFGYIAASDEYVLVNLFHSQDWSDSNDIECMILKFSEGNVESCSWELLDVTCPLLFCRNYLFFGSCEEGALVGNKFFWIGEYNYNSYKMLDFDLESNQLNTIPLPDGFHGYQWQWVEFKEELCLVDTRAPKDSSTMDLWILKDYTNHIWIKEYSIHYPVSGYGDLTLFYFWDGKVLFNVWEKGNQSIQCYDTKTTSFKTITNLTSRSGFPTYVVEFTQSLFSLGTRYVSRSNMADAGDEHHSKKKKLVNASY